MPSGATASRPSAMNRNDASQIRPGVTSRAQSTRAGRGGLPARAGLVLGYGGIAGPRIDEGLTRLAAAFAAVAR